MEIFLLQPAMADAIWAGRKLIDDYGFTIENSDTIAEAWMLSGHPDGLSTVINGKYAGKTIMDVIEAEGRTILGTKNADKEGFPILIKLIDADDKLSIQVHPDDEYAKNYPGENGKTEAWYVVDAKPGATLIYGVKEKMSPEEFADRVRNKTLVEKLNTVEVKNGDVIFIPSKMIHAIGKGILLAEVQQSSNTTYRIYDYDRLKPDGKPRDLHIEKASDVSNLDPACSDFSPEGKTEKIGDADYTYLTGCAYFRMASIVLDGKCEGYADTDSFVSLVVIEGEGKVICDGSEYPIKKGSSVFIPAGAGAYTVEGHSLRILESRT